jgi:hypothetical protein
MGVGVALLDGSSLTMENGSRITGNLFTAGGAESADLGSWITQEPGAEITSNSNEFVLTSYDANHGGGVRLTRGSKLTMKGGLIAGNIITKGNGGGGVYVGSESVFEMQSGEISGNMVLTSDVSGATLDGNGGGVYVDSGGIFRMSGGTIAGNTATGKGGGVYVNGGNFFKTGGAVYGSDDLTNGNTAGSDDEPPAAESKGHAFFGMPASPADKTLPASFSF